MAGGMLGWFAAGRAAPALSDSARIETLFKRHRRNLLIAITAGYGLSYLCRLAIGVVKQPMIDAGVFTPAEFGLIGSALFYAYAFGKLTNGFLADHANVKRFMAFGVLASALCNVGMGLTTSVWAATLLWGLNGWFQGFGAPASVVGLTAWFSNRERGRAYGVWCSAHSLGEGMTFLIVSAAVAAWGWRFGYVVPALIGIATAAMIYVLVPDRPRTLGLPAIADWKNDHVPEGDRTRALSLLRAQLSILSIPTIWILALASAANYITRYGINSWGVLYLQEARGYSLVEAGALLMISTLTGVIGSVAYGFISDRWFSARRPPANLLFGLVEIIGLLMIFYGPDNEAVLIAGLLLFGLGLTGLVASLGGLFAVDICPKRVAGAAMGFIGVFSYLGAALQENVSGLLIDRGSQLIDGARVYDFSGAIQFWIGASIVSLVLAALLWRAKYRD